MWVRVVLSAKRVTGQARHHHVSISKQKGLGPRVRNEEGRTIAFINRCASSSALLFFSHTFAPPCALDALVLMGFFSSRRHDIDVISSSPGPQSQTSSPSPGIIRSRFVRLNAAHILSCVLTL